MFRITLISQLLRQCRRSVLIGSLCLLGSCANLVSSVTGGMAEDLATTILNSNDIDTVRDGVPAYLLMIDSFLVNNPDDPDLLLAASRLNGSFSEFTEGDRSKLLTEKAFQYAARAACIEIKGLCTFRTVTYPEFEALIQRLDRRAVPVVYALGVAWTGYIRAHSDDWNAVAELARLNFLMARVIELDETWDNGGPHLYMGGLLTVLPASMGGKPEEGKAHFERAIQLAEGRFLMTKVIYAQQYARMIFDQALHDRLLREVINADPVQPGMTLTNRIAQERAKVLLAESEDYF